MKKNGIFFCDISGTYFYEKENRSILVNEFIECLKLLKYKENLDILYFCFITSDNIDYLKDAISDIEYHLPEDIVLEKQFFSNGVITTNDEVVYLTPDSKANIIIDSLLNIKDSKSICKIYFADDYSLNHSLLKAINESYNFDITYFELGSSNDDDYKCFYSSGKGLQGLTYVLKKYSKKE